MICKAKNFVVKVILRHDLLGDRTEDLVDQKWTKLRNHVFFQKKFVTSLIQRKIKL